MIALAKPQLNSIDEVIHGEALLVLRTLPDNSVDAIVCDPPAGISFMGKEWDKADTFPLRDRGKLNGTSAHAPHTHERGFANGMHVDNSTRARDAFITFLREVMAEALRVLKPGGHAFVWALPRTSHWTGMALEDAGFEIRDCVNHFYDASTLMQQFLASLTPSQSDAFKALMDSQAVPSLVSHIFGSGFPKSMDVSKAIDKMQGAEREVIGKGINYNAKVKHGGTWTGGVYAQDKYVGANGPLITAPATPEASQWDGWGTALKPASEHWYLARKSLSEKSIAENVLKWGTGAINIDASRVGHNEPLKTTERTAPRYSGNTMNNGVRGGIQSTIASADPQGRWPSNLLLSHSVWCVPNGVKHVRANRIGAANPHDRPDHPTYGKYGYTGGSTSYNDSEGLETVEDWLCDESCPVRLLDEQSGMRKSGGRIAHKGQIDKRDVTFNTSIRASDFHMERSEGTASRYFQRFYYVPKASRAERNRGCEGLPERANRINAPRSSEGEKFSPSPNNHPTVKPINLMRYLVRMITPPGGIVLDCFAGSGSTLVAAIHEGMHFIGIEMNDSEQEPYVTIARARIEQAFREVQV